MEDEILVRICAGTTCYVLGGSELTGLGNRLPPAWRSRVRIEGAVCLDLCRGPGRPPFVEVGGEVVPLATPERVLAALEARLGPGAAR